MALSRCRLRDPAVGGRLPANRSAYPGSGGAGLPRNGWLVSVGITGWLASEWPAAFRRNTHQRRGEGHVGGGGGGPDKPEIYLFPFPFFPAPPRPPPSPPARDHNGGSTAPRGSAGAPRPHG